MRIVERKVQEIGKSLLITLPKDWVKALGVRKGSLLKLLVSEHGSISIAPEFAEAEQSREAIIPFDSYLKRRFIREYFYGNEKITIKLDKGVTERERKEAYDFLKCLMNAQIIEETESKIVVKCFKIEELSMEECLRRMYFLSLNLFDELSDKNDKLKVVEIRDSITKFYYMLVMQVRRFLSEGKFTKENQIPLIRAMDIRMVAEKIQRVAELISAEEPGAEIINILKDTRDYYSKAVLCFFGSDFEKALLLWSEGNALHKKYGKLLEASKKKKNIESYQKLVNMLQALRHSKEISMLIR